MKYAPRWLLNRNYKVGVISVLPWAKKNCLMLDRLKKTCLSKRSLTQAPDVHIPSFETTPARYLVIMGLCVMCTCVSTKRNMFTFLYLVNKRDDSGQLWQVQYDSCWCPEPQTGYREFMNLIHFRIKYLSDIWTAKSLGVDMSLIGLT